MSQEIVIWGEKFNCLKNKDNYPQVKYDFSWCIANGDNYYILIITSASRIPTDEILYICTTLQTSSSFSILRDEIYIPIKEMTIQEIEDFLYYSFGI